MDILFGTLLFIYSISLFLIVYPYLLYPAFLAFLARFSPVSRTSQNIPEKWPTITFIISAYNEECIISEKIANTLGLNYPSDSLQVLVVSDSSSDKTDAIVNEWHLKDERVQLLRQEKRLGKTSGLNAAVLKASGDFIIFSDANAMYQSDAIQELVRCFSDSRVGYVVGAALYNSASDSEATASEGLYWRLELALKQLESRFYSVVGGDGAIYAIRRELFWELKQDDINDFVNPLQIIAHDYYGIFNPNAICFEDAAEEFGKEFRRKRRIVNRTWRAVTRYIHMLNPVKHRRFLFCLISHKIIRWLTLLILGIMTLSNLGLILMGGGTFYVLSLGAIAASLVLALIGLGLDKAGKPMPKLIYLSYYYYLVNTAAILGIWDQVRGVRHAVWTHVRDN